MGANFALGAVLYYALVILNFKGSKVLTANI